MKLHRIARLARLRRRSRRGSALLMAFLMLIVIYAIVFQLWYTTSADLRVTQNDVTVTQIDLAIESSLQEVFDRLRTDGEAEAEQGAAGGGAGAAAAAAAGGGAEGGGGEQSGPTDSREDSWGRAQRTSIGDIELRIFIQDEDSKLNLLTILAEDEEQAEEAFERLVRLLDMMRDGSAVDLDRSEAIRIAEGMRAHLRERTNSLLPRPKLLSDSEEQRDRGMPLSLAEFAVLPRVDENLFRDFRDERAYIVHALSSYVTVWSSPARGSADTEGAAGGGAGGGAGQGTGGQGTQGQGTQGQGTQGQGTQGQGTQGQGTQGQGAGGGAAGGGAAGGGAAGGGAAGGGDQPNWGMMVNVNTAPIAVLKSLFDDRDVPPRFWDAVLEYRNMPEEPEDGTSDSQLQQEPMLDEYGREILQRQIFDSLDELSEVDGYDQLDEPIKARLAQLLSVRSQVFSIYVTARRKTGVDNNEMGALLGTQREDPREDVRGKGLVRTVRCVVWRYVDGEDVRLVPIVRWEVLDYTPLEVLDYPDENR
jgi:type II secretory pathway component PulK